ncbi:Fic family protein [Szabonella alba]|uniref:Fic family protein n=1 Tax=Szabonella alba TaxID=2804194 RepID=A0A8K0Y2G0_9RHOB|nr:Fic family protein [Szabonella alba]MBL4919307.1 Fic family protein [Szabonella alba]
MGRPYHGYHRAIHLKCAALLHGVATSHGFSDGNKRSAWACTFVLIDRSGYSLETLPGDRIDDVVVDVVERKLSLEDLAAWFKVRLVRA